MKTKPFILMLFLIGCGVQEPHTETMDKAIDSVQSYYNIDLSYVQITLRDDLTESCGRNDLYGCSYPDGRVYVKNDWCGEIAHELMHNAAQELYGEVDYGHELLDWTLPFVRGGFCR
jgi:hypothetical protein